MLCNRKRSKDEQRYTLDAVATIYEATIQALVRSSQNLMKEKERVSNLVKYNDPTPSDDQRQLASINDHDFVFLSFQDDAGVADIFDENDLLAAIHDATKANVSIDIIVKVDYLVNSIQQRESSERVDLKKDVISIKCKWTLDQNLCALWTPRLRSSGTAATRKTQGITSLPEATLRGNKLMPSNPGHFSRFARAAGSWPEVLVF